MDALLLVALGIAVGLVLPRLWRVLSTALGSDTQTLYDLATAAQPHYQAAAHPKDVLDDPAFEGGVVLLLGAEVTDARRLEYCRGDNQIIACMALEAISRAHGEDDVGSALLGIFVQQTPWVMWFALRALEARAGEGEALLGRVLVSLGEEFDYQYNRFYLSVLGEFVSRRLEAGEAATFAGALEHLPPESEETLRGTLKRLDPAVGSPLLDELRSHRPAAVDVSFLESIGHVWRAGEGPLAEPLVEDDVILESLDAVEALLQAERPPSIVLVGEAGVGKTAFTRLLGRRLVADGWTVFEAGAQELVAGQSYLGQLEQRMQSLVKRLTASRRVLWFIPDLHALLIAGRHKYSTTSVLDEILPHVEARRLTILTEARPEPFDLLTVEHPRLATSLQLVRLEPTGEAATLELAGRWAELHRAPEGPPLLAPEVLEEGWQLALQFLGSKASPGNLIQLLELTRQRLATRGAQVIGVEDLIATVGQITGLPASILDEREGLDLDALRALFEERVMGQPEAVSTLVERVAMIKAGVCDPTRPLGVFLFAGPTGTGKTEIVKTLARFLFGSTDRIVRLDMSELQTADALVRILGEPQADVTGGPGGSLVDRVRREPFCVVLLDEIEKAHANVWDLFLQVFDDGRLTDRRGVAADFRHAIVVMTSNLGSAIASGPALGFAERAGGFSTHDVGRALERTFRKEFLNRIDRTVVFRPLPREVMRRILARELADAFQRRGLRNREWAVEWSDAAVDFLLDEGFSPDLGARPLKRAIEQHLLAPLAIATVNRELPTGDQFLFIGSDGTGLTVDFIDPDAPSEAAEAGAGGDEEADAAASLESITLQASGRRAELAVVERRYEELARRLAAPEWKERKGIALSMTELPDFWDSPERFAILEQAEYLDRIDSGFRTAGSLIERLRGGDGERDHGPPELVRKLAQRIFLLEAAVDAFESGSGWEAWVAVEEGRGPARGSAASARFASELAAMYVAWGNRRGMRVRVLEESAGGAEGYAKLLAVSGFAAYDLLVPERGIHVFEEPSDHRAFERLQALVSVARQGSSGGQGSDSELADAKAALAADPAPRQIVRRYRRHPSPLVRDGMRGWRTGRLDLVMAGNFDVMG